MRLGICIDLGRWHSWVKHLEARALGDAFSALWKNTQIVTSDGSRGLGFMGGLISVVVSVEVEFD